MVCVCCTHLKIGWLVFRPQNGSGFVSFCVSIFELYKYFYIAINCDNLNFYSIFVVWHKKKISSEFNIIWIDECKLMFDTYTKWNIALILKWISDNFSKFIQFQFQNIYRLKPNQPHRNTHIGLKTNTKIDLMNAPNDIIKKKEEKKNNKMCTPHTRR